VVCFIEVHHLEVGACSRDVVGVVGFRLLFVHFTFQLPSLDIHPTERFFALLKVFFVNMAESLIPGLGAAMV